MENDDIVATLCIIIVANAVKIIRKKYKDVGDNGSDLGYKGEANMEPIMHYCK